MIDSDTKMVMTAHASALHYIKELVGLSALTSTMPSTSPATKTARLARFKRLNDQIQDDLQQMQALIERG